MKVKPSEEPQSAFAIYSEKLKQKKKSKPIKNAGVMKVGKPKDNKGFNSQSLEQMKEIGLILKSLTKQSKNSNTDLLQSIENAHFKLKNTPHESKEEVDSLGLSMNLPPSLLKQMIGDDSEDNEERPNRSRRKQRRKNQKVKQSNEPVSIKSEDESNSDSISEHSNSDIGTNVNGNKVNGFKISNNRTKKTNIKNTKNRNKKQSVLLKSVKEDSESETDDESTTHEIQPKNRYESTSLRVQKTEKLKPNKISKKKVKGGLKKNEPSLPQNSAVKAKHLFEWLVTPVEEHNFMKDYWEQQPLLIKREDLTDYYSELLSTPAIDKMLRENNIFFTKHLDVTSYTNGVRETHNLSGRAQANVVWDFYANGCSVRLLNPQAFFPKVHALNAMLQEYFGCFVGANVYLTPPNSQGFAPHYDDIEAFVLQIEGKKRWKVYSPRNKNETLARFSSPNFSQEDVGEPMLDVVLEPGDLLYFPRGFIHQATTVDNQHSLHITLSAYQKTAWVDLLEKTIPIALKRAAAEDVDFRRGLPRDYLNIEHYGSSEDKRNFVNTAERLMAKLGHFLTLSLGAGVDQMGAQFMHDALPPVFTPEEKAQSSLGGGLKMEEDGELNDGLELTPETKIRLIRPNVCRLVEEEGEVRLYHCLDNPLEYHAEDPQFLVLPPEGVSVITLLSRKYPNYVPVSSIPHTNLEALLALVSDLWDSGLLATVDLSS